MLASIGAADIDEILRAQIPDAARLDRPLQLPAATHELSLTAS